MRPYSQYILRLRPTRARPLQKLQQIMSTIKSQIATRIEVMPLTMAMNTEAIAEMIELIADPIAENTLPIATRAYWLMMK